MTIDLLTCAHCNTAPRYLPHNAGFYDERVICDNCHYHLSVAIWQARATAPPVILLTPGEDDSSGTYCLSCRGEGIVHTGCDEASSTNCASCDGTGYQPAPALQEGQALTPPSWAAGYLSGTMVSDFNGPKITLRFNTTAEAEAAFDAFIALQEGSEQPPENQQKGQPAALRAAPAIRLNADDAGWRERVREIATWLDSQCNQQQISPEEFAYVSEFDYNLARAAAELFMVAAPVEQTTSTDTNNEKGQA